MIAPFPEAGIFFFFFTSLTLQFTNCNYSKTSVYEWNKERRNHLSWKERGKYLLELTGEVRREGVTGSLRNSYWDEWAVNEDTWANAERCSGFEPWTVSVIFNDSSPLFPLLLFLCSLLLQGMPLNFLHFCNILTLYFSTLLNSLNSPSQAQPMPLMGYLYYL